MQSHSSICCKLVFLRVKGEGGEVPLVQVVFGGLWLLSGDFRWFQVVCCFSSYTNFTEYRRVNFFLCCAHGCTCLTEAIQIFCSK